MRIRCGVAAAWLLSLGALIAAPPLTTIQDTLYRADGSRFNGVAFVEWKSFQAADFSNIATHSVTVPIRDGAIRVRLVPTTNATPGAYYSVRYHSDGRIQFDEIWAVPPSTATLRLRDVRVLSPSSGSVVLPPPGNTQILLSDVAGLTDELEARPLKGPGYAPGRAAFITEQGTLEAVAGDLTDCVRVDGTAGPCDMASGPGYVDAETPAGAINGANRWFTLTQIPSPPASLALFRNGLLQRPGVDYSLSGAGITFTAGTTPQPGDVLAASYRLADGSNPPWTAAGAVTVLCGGTGSSTSSTSWTSLGSCTIPANTLAAGDRVVVSFGFTHEGTSSAPSIELRWGGTAVISRPATAAETQIVGRSEFGLYTGGALWAAQDWGASLALSSGTGIATAAFSAPLAIELAGRFASSTTDTLTLRNYTVVRHAAAGLP